MEAETDPTRPDLETGFTRHLQRADRLKSKMLDAASDHRWRDFREHQGRYLVSRSAALAAVVAVTKKSKRKRTPEEIERLAISQVALRVGSRDRRCGLRCSCGV